MGVVSSSSKLVSVLQSNPGLPIDMPRTDPPISAETVSLLMNATVSILGADKLLTPDDLRGDYDSLREALGTLGPEQFWPDVDAVRGKIIIVGGGEALPACVVLSQLCTVYCRRCCRMYHSGKI